MQGSNGVKMSERIIKMSCWASGGLRLRRTAPPAVSLDNQEDGGGRRTLPCLCPPGVGTNLFVWRCLGCPLEKI